MRQIDDPKIYAKYHCTRWYKLRKLKKAESNGFCERCLKKGIYKEGVIVHHKEHINSENYDNDLVMYNLDNLELLCTECHLEEHQNHKEYYFDKEGNVCSAERD